MTYEEHKEWLEKDREKHVERFRKKWKLTQAGRITSSAFGYSTDDLYVADLRTRELLFIKEAQPPQSYAVIRAWWAMLTGRTR